MISIKNLNIAKYYLDKLTRFDYLKILFKKKDKKKYRLIKIKNFSYGGGICFILFYDRQQPNAFFKILLGLVDLKKNKILNKSKFINYEFIRANMINNLTIYENYFVFKFFYNCKKSEFEEAIKINLKYVSQNPKEIPSMELDNNFHIALNFTLFCQYSDKYKIFSFNNAQNLQEDIFNLILKSNQNVMLAGAESLRKKISQITIKKYFFDEKNELHLIS